MQVSVTRQVPEHIESLAPYRASAILRFQDEFGLTVSEAQLRVVSVGYTRGETDVETMTVTFALGGKDARN
jgi:hypothetical protein